MAGKLDRFNVERKEGLKKYKEIYEPYASNRDLMGLPHTKYTIEGEDIIVLEDAYEGSLGIESKVYISAFNNSNLTKYEVPKMLLNIIYDTENILMQSGERINTIQFSTAYDFVLKVKDLNFNALTSVFQTVLLSQIMFRYPGIENKMYSSNLNNTNFDHVKGVIPKDGIFRDITTLSCDTGTGVGILSSKLNVVDFSTIEHIEGISTILHNNIIKVLKIKDNVLSLGVTIASSCTIDHLVIEGEAYENASSALFYSCNIKKVTLIAKRINSKLFDSCTIGVIQLYIDNNKEEASSKGYLSKNPVEFIDENAFYKTCFIDSLAIVTKECHKMAFNACTFKDNMNFIFTESEINDIPNLYKLPYDIRFIKLPLQQQKLYVLSDNLKKKLQLRSVNRPY